MQFFNLKLCIIGCFFSNITLFLFKKFIMILYRKYDADKNIDMIWYKSSNIIYSECLDNENDYKTLKVVFKNGQSYTYKKVDVNDYVLFVHGGIDGSNGKALNKFIKPKYEFEKTEIFDTDLLNATLENNLKQNNKEKNGENHEEINDKEDNCGEHSRRKDNSDE